VTEAEKKELHSLYGVRRPRIAYRKEDFLDYALMLVGCASLIYVSYRGDRVLSAVGVALCCLMLVSFVVRHGFALRVPVLVKRPQDVLYLFIYKIRNIRWVFLFGVGVLLVENYVISLTPQLPHHVAWMHAAALVLFYSHVVLITAYRTYILVDHLKKKDRVREVLSQTTWKRSVAPPRSVSFEIWHAYSTGLLTHIVLIAPWYVVIRYFDFSILLLALVLPINLFTHFKLFKPLWNWYYRDHWLGHNSELEFLYLHGTHHDAIPSGMIGVAGNGFLEGYARNTLGFPIACYTPLAAFLAFTAAVKADMDMHQYIPGIFPRLPRAVHEVYQHSTHHFGHLAPYSLGFDVDQAPGSETVKRLFGGAPDELKYSMKLDEELNGFKWDNDAYRKFMALYDKYRDSRMSRRAGRS